jgi:hypothetical protein
VFLSAITKRSAPFLALVEPEHLLVSVSVKVELNGIVTLAVATYRFVQRDACEVRSAIPRFRDPKITGSDVESASLILETTVSSMVE